LLSRKATLAHVLKALGPVLDRLEVALRDVERRVPPALAGEIKALVARIPATHKDARRRTIAQRLQVDVALLTQMETLQRRFHVTREMLPVGQGRRGEVDVLYIGLARGLAVSADGSWAAIGVPGKDGWGWTVRPEMASDVRKAISVFHREAPATLVSLPLGTAMDADGGKGAETP
jgi:hypothetical protein